MASEARVLATTGPRRPPARCVPHGIPTEVPIAAPAIKPWSVHTHCSASQSRAPPIAAPAPPQTVERAPPLPGAAVPAPADRRPRPPADEHPDRPAEQPAGDEPAGGGGACLDTRRGRRAHRTRRGGGVDLCRR